MSILLGPYERSDPSEKVAEEELLVFGYACKLYRDDAKALMEESGQLLIPWMGDGSLMIDRCVFVSVCVCVCVCVCVTAVSRTITRGH